METLTRKNYGFESGVTPQNDHDLDGFERKIMHMAENIRPIDLDR